MGFGLLSLRSIFIAGVLVLFVSGCEVMGARHPAACEPAVQARLVATPAEKKLNYGVLSFEEGNYPAATMALQGVLDAPLSNKQEHVKAYKYLAFIQCVSGREPMCRDNFKKALEIDPNFSLDSAEAGHPIWGPVFRSVKSKLAK